MESIINLIASLLGIQPIQLIALGFNALMGVISMPILIWLKTFLGKVPFISEAMQDKVKGWIMVFLGGVIGLGFVLLGQLLGLHVLESSNLYDQVVVALGINQTFSAAFFEWWKSKHPKPATAVTK